MEAKLKSLKVAELKDILSKASAPAPAKTNKQDLINRILATPAAVQVYNQLHSTTPQTKSAQKSTATSNPSSHDDLLAPPEDLDWTVEESGAPAPVAVPDVKKPSTQDPPQQPAGPPVAKLSQPEAPVSAAPPPKVTALSSTENAATIDEELEKRKARAARFGIPLVEQKPSRSPRAKKAAGRSTTNTSVPSDEPEKLKARADRFGINTSDQSAKKSSKRAPVEEVDPEEQERRRKRAERFGSKNGKIKV